MADDLRRLAEGLGTALQDWARSSAVQEPDDGWTDKYRTVLEGRGVIINTDDTLVFDPERPELDYPLPVLARTIGNAAERAAEVYDYAKGSCKGHVKQNKRSTLRKAATMRDSLSQVARLLRGEDLGDEPWELDIEPTLEILNLREAHIFKMVKTVKARVRGDKHCTDEWIATQLEDILDFIKDKKPIPTREED